MREILTCLSIAVAIMFRWAVSLIGLVLTVQMINERQMWTALALFAGMLIMFPPTGRYLLGRMKRPWLGVAGAAALIFFVAPIVSIIDTPSVEEMAVREQKKAIALAESVEREAARKKEREAEKAREEAQNLKKKCSNDISAFVMSQSFVKDRLRAPATADFPSILDAKVSATGDCRFKVHAYVDSQNGFGAMIRTRYTADIELDPLTDRWKLKDLQMQ